MSSARLRSSQALTDSSVFEFLRRDVAPQSNCPKSKLGAALVKDGHIVSYASNPCAPHPLAYEDEIADCIRMAVPQGALREACRGIHAEVRAMLDVRRSRSFEELAQFAAYLLPSMPDAQIRVAFTAQELGVINDSVLFVTGHHYVCPQCRHFASVMGIAGIKIDPVGAQETIATYVSRGRSDLI